MVDIEKANEKAFKRLINAMPVWTDIERAIDVITRYEKESNLHSGHQYHGIECVVHKKAQLLVL